MIVQHLLAFRDHDELFFRKVSVVEYRAFSLRDLTPQVLHLNFWLHLALNPFLKSMILHKEVDLEKDITDKDQYGRSLRYVWLDNKLVNAEIVRAGVAIAKQYDPDTKYQRIIADAEQEAIEKQVGCLWSPEVKSTTISVPALTPTQTPTLPTSVNAKAGETSYVNEALPPAPPTHIIINEVEATPLEKIHGYLDGKQKDIAMVDSYPLHYSHARQLIQRQKDRL